MKDFAKIIWRVLIFKPIYYLLIAIIVVLFIIFVVLFIIFSVPFAIINVKHRANFTSFFVKNTNWTGLGTYYDEIKLMSRLKEWYFRADLKTELRLTFPKKYFKKGSDTKEGNKIFYFGFNGGGLNHPDSLDLIDLVCLPVEHNKWAFDHLDQSYSIVKLAREMYQRDWLQDYLDKLHEHQKVLADKGEAFDQKSFDEIIMKGLKVEIRRSFVGGNGKKPKIKEVVQGWRDRFMPA